MLSIAIKKIVLSTKDIGAIWIGNSKFIPVFQNKWHAA